MQTALTGPKKLQKYNIRDKGGVRTEYVPTGDGYIQPFINHFSNSKHHLVQLETF